MIHLVFYLFVSAFLFSCGISCILIRKNLIRILMGVELVLNASALNFAAFSVFLPTLEPSLQLSGQMMSLFVIALAAAEAVVALALILSIYRFYQTIQADQLETLKG